jgi:hypothetical protein|tara:strand:- start:880 stop:1143 length:264 start_codon:yes stop_codon:yes gene_type:complete
LTLRWFASTLTLILWSRQCAQTSVALIWGSSATLFRHKMIYFRDQRFSYHDQDAFSLQFAADAYGEERMEEHSNVNAVIKEADARAT